MQLLNWRRNTWVKKNWSPLSAFVCVISISKNADHPWWEIFILRQWHLRDNDRASFIVESINYQYFRLIFINSASLPLLPSYGFRETYFFNLLLRAYKITNCVCDCLYTIIRNWRSRATIKFKWLVQILFSWHLRFWCYLLNLLGTRDGTFILGLIVLRSPCHLAPSFHHL